MKRFEQMLTTVMAMAAITVAVILVKREFAGPGGGTASVAGPVSTVDSAGAAVFVHRGSLPMAWMKVGWT